MTDQTAGAGLEAQPMAEAEVSAANDQINQPEQVAEQAEPKTPDELRKLQNALSQRDRRIGKLTAQKYQYQQELEALRQRQSQYEQKVDPKASAEPKLDDFDNLETYQKAMAKFVARQELQEHQKAQNEIQQKSRDAEWEEERNNHLDEDTIKAREVFSDFDQVFNENLPIVQGALPHVIRAFREAENGAHAFYQLAKDGELPELNDMSPYKVAMAIARAEVKALSHKKPVTNAPAPIASNKGTSAGIKPLNAMSGDDLLKWMKS